MMVRIMAGAIALAATGPVAAQTVGPVLPGLRPTIPQGPAEVSHNAPVNGVLTLFGNERCPTDNNGNEVVVCVRTNASEQYRIPKTLREFKITPENQAWAVKAQGLVNDSTVGGGVGSCSTVGPGGQSGCFLKQAEASRRENKDKKEDQQKLEASLP